jgi:hypothetical protein
MRDNLKSNFYYGITIFTAVLIRFWIPPDPFFNTPADDLLMVELARNLLDGEWLGNWIGGTTYPGVNIYKPPGYSLFLVLSYFLYLPPQVVLIILYLLISYLFTNYVLKCREIEKKLVFTFLAFNPILYSNEFSRLYRDSLILVLTWGSAVFTLLLLRSIREKNRGSKIYFIIFVNSLLIGYLKIVKNDFYLFSSIFLLAALIYLFFIEFRQKNEKKNIKLFINPILIFILTTNSLTFVIENMNYNQYSVKLVEDNNSGAFAAAWKQMSRIRITDDPWQNYPISPAMFEKLNIEIESFKSLSPYMLGDTGWKQSNCERAGECTGSSGPWVQNELRDAAIAGGVENAADFQNLFNKIATEIELYCAEKKDNCYISGTIFGGPALSSEKINFKGTVDSFFRSISDIYSWKLAKSSRVIYYDEKYGKWPEQIKTFNETIRGLHYRTHNIQPTSEALYLKYSVNFLQVIYSFTLSLCLFLLLISILLRLYFHEKINKILIEEKLLISSALFTIIASILYAFVHANGWFILDATQAYFIPFSTYLIVFQYICIKYFFRIIRMSLLIFINNNRI